MKIFVIAFSLLFSGIVRADFASETAPFFMGGETISGLLLRTEPAHLTGFSKLGVKKGDVIVAVNHVPITNKEGAEAAYANRSPQSITIIRKDRKILLEAK